MQKHSFFRSSLPVINQHIKSSFIHLFPLLLVCYAYSSRRWAEFGGDERWKASGGFGRAGGWSLRVWREQLGVWWQNGLREFKSSLECTFLFGWQLQEGRLLFSKAMALFILHIFIEGLFQRHTAYFSCCLCFITDRMFASRMSSLYFHTTVRQETNMQQNRVLLSRTRLWTVNTD